LSYRRNHNGAVLVNKLMWSLRCHELKPAPAAKVLNDTTGATQFAAMRLGVVFGFTR
jgi:hypothetical protein